MAAEGSTNQAGLSGQSPPHPWPSLSGPLGSSARLCSKPFQAPVTSLFVLMLGQQSCTAPLVGRCSDLFFTPTTQPASLVTGLYCCLWFPGVRWADFNWFAFSVAFQFIRKDKIKSCPVCSSLSTKQQQLSMLIWAAVQAGPSPWEVFGGWLLSISYSKCIKLSRMRRKHVSIIKLMDISSLPPQVC